MTVPIKGRVFTFKQPDGSPIEVKVWGDQHYAVFEDLNGFALVRDPVTGFFEYARLNDDETELRPSGMRAHRGDPGELALPRHLRVRRGAARAQALSARDVGGGKRRWEQRIEEKRQAARVADMARLSGLVLAPPSEETVGEFVGLCLLIQFPDVAGTIPPNAVDDFCNLTGYGEFGNQGSVYDYFFDVSNRRLRYTNILTEYYTARHPRAYYTDPQVPMPVRARELIREALTQLRSTGFDFRSLSKDSGGYIRALNVYYAGARVNTWSEGLWPHSWRLAVPFEVGPDLRFLDYQITDMGEELTLATFCHENGHMICDFPDLYDYGYESSGIGDYCLMCGGGPDPKNPVRVCAYLSRKAGWAESVRTLTRGMSTTLAAGRNEYLLHAKSPREYFVIENRHATGRDRDLPSSGLAIWHVDETGSNNDEQGTPVQHYECSLEQADGRRDLEHGRNDGDQGDLFSNATQDAFGLATNPASLWWDGSNSGLQIENIGPAGPQISLSMTCGQTALEEESEPGLSIPDSPAAGVEDEIVFTAEGRVGSVEVEVDIAHSYRGDLRVTLLAPSGAAAVLHDRQGGGQDHLRETYDAASSTALRGLLGEAIPGSWKLRVEDRAPRDTGTLNRWRMRVVPAAGSRVRMQESPGMTIPDNDPSGIERTLTTPETGTVGEVAVEVDITHSYVGDLTVQLVSPAGTSVDLHRRAGGSSDNIIETFTATSLPDLAGLSGETIQGPWRLKVADHQGLDVGKLNRWAVEIVPKTVSPTPTPLEEAMVGSGAA